MEKSGSPKDTDVRRTAFQDGNFYGSAARGVKDMDIPNEGHRSTYSPVASATVASASNLAGQPDWTSFSSPEG